MNRTPGKSYVDQRLVLLAEFDSQTHVHFPKGEVDGVDSRIMIMDDIALEDRARMKDTNFGLNYGGHCPILDVDYAELEKRMEQLWSSTDVFVMNNQFRELEKHMLSDGHVVQRKRKLQAKQWETKAAIKSRQLRNRKKGR